MIISENKFRSFKEKVEILDFYLYGIIDSYHTYYLSQYVNWTECVVVTIYYIFDTSEFVMEVRFYFLVGGATYYSLYNKEEMLNYLIKLTGNTKEQLENLIEQRKKEFNDFISQRNKRGVKK